MFQIKKKTLCTIYIAESKCLVTAETPKGGTPSPGLGS